MAELAYFQTKTAEYIVDRLRSRTARFLLADEVGLGKTIVAGDVIRRLAAIRESKRRQYIVVYLVSNLQISSQNAERLIGKRAVIEIERIAELSARRRNRAAGPIVYALTPGTSLRRGTGDAWERAVLYQIACELPEYRGASFRKRCSGLFRYSAGDESWKKWIRTAQSQGLIKAIMQTTVQNWRRAKGPDGGRLLDELASSLETKPTPRRGSRIAGYPKQRKLIEKLRHGLLAACLSRLRPDFVVCDEAQRFPEVLEDADKTDTLASRLLRHSRCLMLSATPFKMYTNDDGTHREGLVRVLSFLRHESPQDTRSSRIFKELGSIERALRDGTFLHRNDRALIRARKYVELELRKLMCRTERRWYHGGAQDASANEIDGGAVALPDSAELRAFLRLYQYVLDRRLQETRPRLTDFWKTAPGMLSFIDSHYALARAYRRGLRRKNAPPIELVPHRHDLRGLWRENGRFRAFFETLFASCPDPTREGGRSLFSWPFLWCAPTRRYYKDDLFGSTPPSKFLVFCYWRFAPRAIGVLGSEEAGRRIGMPRDGGREKPPLRLAADALTLFSVCHPSPALANLVNPVSLLQRYGAEASHERHVRAAMRVIREALARAKCGRQGGRKARWWELLARLDAIRGDKVMRALASVRDVDGSVSAEFKRLRRRYRKALVSEEPLRFDDRDVRRLAEIALFSPAVCLLRAVQTAYADSASQHLPQIFQACFGSVRSYLNRPLVVRIIRRASGRSGNYAERVLAYCRRGHLQSVLDEYLHLLRSGEHDAKPDEAVKQLIRVLNLSGGRATVHLRPGDARHVGKKEIRSTHFAMAMSEDSEDIGPPDEQVRPGEYRRAVREAFNSPFWPFVLATTAVGQEGLDFHMYCDRVVHWNLPSSPIDYEQREGRVDRRSGLGIRRALAPLILEEAVGTAEAPHYEWWDKAWRLAEQHAPKSLSALHGLVPYWLRSDQGARSLGTAGYQRYLFFFEGSRDLLQLERLRQALTLYRLTFGQPQQADLVELLRQHIDEAEQAGHSDIRTRLRRYMVCLAPPTLAKDLDKLR